VAATVGVYVGAVAVMVALDRYGFIWKSLIVPGLVLAALVTRRFARFVNDWAVFLGAVVLFDFCRGLIFAVIGQFGLHVYLGYVVDWERWLCGGELAPSVLQRWRALLADPVVVDHFFVIVHASHFLGFLLFGFVIWHVRPAAFRQYAWAMTLLMYLGLMFYLLVPTVPPWMAANDFRAIPSIAHIGAAIYNLELPELVVAFDINPIAAMPSLHTAFPTLGALIALQHFGWRGAAMAVYACLVGIAIVYLGEHYVVDVIAGAALAAAVFALARQRLLASPDRPADRLDPRQLAWACGLVAVGFAVGQLTLAVRQPLPVSRSFVLSELAGRSDKTHYYLGRIAYARGEFADAQQELTRALSELHDDEDRREARRLLAMSAFRAGDFRTTIATLEAQDGLVDDNQQLLLLASSYVESGAYEQGVALLEAVRLRFPDDPEPLYWLTRYAFLHGRIDGQHVQHVVEQLATSTSVKSRPLRLALQQLVVGVPAAVSSDAEGPQLLRAAAAQR
jgi:membrane-associated phospholipid phosphatase